MLKKIKLSVIAVVVFSLVFTPIVASAATFAASSNMAGHTTMYVAKGKTATVYGRNLASGDKVKTFKSSNTAVVTVSGKGVIRGKKVGSATITLVTAKGKKDSIKIRVVKSSKKMKSISVPKSKSVNIKSTVRLLATANPVSSTDRVTWKSTNPRVVSVGKDGYITGKKLGKAIITVRSSSGKSASCIVTVRDPVKISAKSRSVRVDRTTTLTASAPSGKIIWSSSDTGIATVSQSGKITPKRTGTVTIKAATVNGTSASCTVKVVPHITSTSTSVSPSSKNILAGRTVTLKATLKSSDPDMASNDDIKWTSSNTKIATVSQSGVVTGRKFGAVTIIATSESGHKDSATVNVKTIVPQRESLQLTPGVQYYVKNNTYGLGSNPKFTYSSSNKSIATVSSSGLVSVNQRKADGDVVTGTVNITTTTADGDKAVTKVVVVDMPTIVDISKFQGDIDWDRTAKTVDLAIMRATYGPHAADYEPKYASNALAAQSRGVPYGAYGFATYNTKAEAIKEATLFYKTAFAGGRKPTFLVVDCEYDYITRANTEAYIAKLRSLAGYRIKVGVYIGHHLYRSLNLNLTTNTSNPKTPDFVWIPRYSYANDGTITGVPAPSYTADMWQFSSGGRIPGISGRVDLNTMFYASGAKISNKSGFSLEWLSKAR